VQVESTRAALKLYGHRHVSQWADSSSGGSQQYPRDEAELRCAAQRGKVPDTLQQTDQKV